MSDPVRATLTSPGSPLTDVQNIPDGVDFGLLFSRPDNFAALGLSYEIQFSHDLF